MPKDINESFTSLFTDQRYRLFESDEFPGVRGTPRVGPMDGPDASVDDVTTSAANIHEPDTLTKLNGWLSALSAKQYLNPYFAVNTIQTKLALIGLSFPAVMFIGESGVVRTHLSQFGGRFGRLDFANRDAGLQDDGISHKIPGGLDLEITFQCIKGLYNIEAQIVPAIAAPPSITEEDEKDEKKQCTEEDGYGDTQFSKEKPDAKFLQDKKDVTESMKSFKEISTIAEKYLREDNQPIKSFSLDGDTVNITYMNGKKEKETKASFLAKTQRTLTPSLWQKFKTWITTPETGDYDYDYDTTVSEGFLDSVMKFAIGNPPKNEYGDLGPNADSDIDDVYYRNMSPAAPNKK